ncbi:chloride channel protein [Oricola cellulosilytica]|uniref:Chloride channel protein n=1 Tax=Oricola cellulosilytica TaxID=1429082 RepID=A0A4R0PCL2_9HYPH|nr:chloride channel protein [Oricola cellulosilytica]TCD15210.1 chloride channel protein [Oricola cellulosilytica]
MIETLKRVPAIVASWVRPNIETFLSTGQPKIWALSLLIGAAVGIAAILFRESIGLFQMLWLGTRSEDVVTSIANLEWYWVLLAPVAGGAIVGVLLHQIGSRRTGGVADVIEAKAHAGRPLDFRDGILSALTTAISLGFGASAGREGPVVHLGATLASVFSHRRKLPEWCVRTLLAAGVASAVSASFNAPIAGVLFAHEVILQHYAFRSFVPIVIASTAGTVLSRLWFDEATVFIVPDYQITSYWEFPAFALLGVVSAIVAILFQFALVAGDYVARNITMPLFFRPVVGGLAVGMIGVFFPHILGVGYEMTDKALWNQLPLLLMLSLIVMKTVATAITLASRFGGGVFSPSLYLGAMTGGAFGLIAGSVFPGLASSGGLYAILGMGAVAGAVIGAPISTTVIVFELTGGYALSIALLLTVAIAYGINQAIHGHSYFHWQLEMRGLFIHEGPHRSLTRAKKVMDFMDMPDEEGGPQVVDPELKTPTLKPTDTLEHALRIFDAGGHTRLPVVDERAPDRIIGWANQVRALRYFNKALIDASVEEHR